MYIYDDPAQPTKVSTDEKELSEVLSPFLSMIGYYNLYDNIIYSTPNKDNIYTINITFSRSASESKLLHMTRGVTKYTPNMLFSPSPDNTLLGVSTGQPRWWNGDHKFLYNYINNSLYYHRILPEESGLKVIGISRVKNTTEKELVIKIEVEQGPRPKSGGKKKRSRKKRKSTKQKRYIKKKRHTKKKYKTII